MLIIDGSYGEGGGQILRTALSLAVIFSKPIKLINIRASRPKPGLQPQHLTCVKALAFISQAEIRGAELNSKELIFVPKEVQIKNYYSFDIGTAGSVSLLFQALLYPLALTQDTVLYLKGGTHVPFSPCSHYIEMVFLPIVALMGLKVDFKLKKVGFYPKGGGEVEIRIYPWKDFQLPNFSPGFSPEKIRIISLISEDLPSHILERQTRSCKEILEKHGLKPEVDLQKVKSLSSGTAVFLCAEDQNKRVGFSSLGKRGLPAEKVGEKPALEFLNFLQTGAQLEEYLSDQILLPLSLILWKNKGFKFLYKTSKISKHLMTQAWLIPKFLKEIEIKLEKTGEIILERRE